MTILYADTSALVGAYLPDEVDHGKLRELLLEGAEIVTTSQIARVELASAVTAAARAGRLLGSPDDLLNRFDSECTAGSIALIDLRPSRVLQQAYELVRGHRLRALDAIHLAVAIHEASLHTGGEDVALVTRDEDQAAAARALGLAVR